MPEETYVGVDGCRKGSQTAQRALLKRSASNEGRILIINYSNRIIKI